MDDIDRKIALMLFENPRVSIREIAEKLRISRQAANHRMQVLEKIGFFKNIIVHISRNYLDATVVIVWGICKDAPMKKILDRIGESEFTVSAIVAGGNYLFVWGLLRRATDLEGFVEFVKQAAEMPEPTAGIICYYDGINPEAVDDRRLKEGCKELSPLDLKIIASIMFDARKPIAEIADEVNATARTVRRRLENMISEGKLAFYSPWDVPAGEDVLTLMQISLRHGADKGEVGRRLISKNPVLIQVIRSFTNIPDLLLGLLGTHKMSEVRRILREVEEDEDVLSVTPNLLYDERVYMSWDLELPTTLTRSSEKARMHHPNPGFEKR